MNSIDLSIQQYNRKIPFFRWKNRIKKAEGDFLFGEYFVTSKPVIFNQSILRNHVLVLGNKNRSRDLFLKYILDKIELNEHFIFINNSFINEDDFKKKIIEHSTAFKYQYPIVFNNLSEFVDQTTDISEKCYVINLNEIYCNMNQEDKDSTLLNHDDSSYNFFHSLVYKKIMNYYSDVYENNFTIPNNTQKSILLAGIQNLNRFHFGYHGAQSRSLGFNIISYLDLQKEHDTEWISCVNANTHIKFIFTEKIPKEETIKIADFNCLNKDFLEEKNYVCFEDNLVRIK